MLDAVYSSEAAWLSVRTDKSALLVAISSAPIWIEQMLRRFIDRIDLSQRDVRQITNVSMRARQRPETESAGQKLK